MINLKLKEGKQYKIGKHGLLKLRYLNEHNKGLYTKLLINSYLYAIKNLVKEKVNELIIYWLQKEILMKNLKMIIKCYR